MSFIYGLNIHKCQKIIVFINFAAGKYPIYYLAKNTVFHITHFPYFKKLKSQCIKSFLYFNNYYTAKIFICQQLAKFPLLVYIYDYMLTNAAIISVGNELLNGHTVNTNSNWLCGRLLTVSIPVIYNCDIGDDIEGIKNAIEYASGKADIILITGGLGPTDDDITRDGIAKFMGVELEYHPDIFEKIKKFFTAINRPMVEKNKIQAYLPAGTSEIENNTGTAPGIFYENGKKIIAAMPGVPSEMKQMFDEAILPKLKKISSGNFLVIRKIRCIGAGESAIAEMLGATEIPL
jgi:molybdenum cofactor synthesis domain-containing protein